MDTTDYEGLPDGFLQFEELNFGALAVYPTLKVSLLNEAGRTFLNTNAAVREPVALAECLLPESEEFHILQEIAVGQRKLRDTVTTWEVGGQIRHVMMDSTPVSNFASPSRLMLVTMKDLGNIVTLEHHVQRSDQINTIGKVAAGIAHEIRNPLTTIKGFAQLLEKRFTDKEDEDLVFAQMMLREIDRVNELVGELLLLSKPQNFDRQLCDVTQLVADLGVYIRSEAQERGIVYQWDSTPVPLVYINPSMIRHAVSNLVQNAIEAMGEEGRLSVNVHPHGPWVCIDVSDTGPGIPYYQFDRIFDVFFTTKEKGTGLGLPVCQRIAASHEGEIRVASKGFGSVFSLLLPAADQAKVGEQRSS